ncbi:MAG: FkbM family methyltransferase [Acidobacteriota bacterium]
MEVMRSVVREGDTAFDIGANIGLHSILLSRLVGPGGRLYAFEPNPELIPALMRTVSELENALLDTVALSDENSETLLFVPSDNSMGSLTDWTANTDYSDEGGAHTVRCEQRRMDDLIESGSLPQPHFIKCDVEGAEMLVFKGGHRSLNRADAPIILFEANKEASEGFGYGASAAKDYLANLEDAKYVFFQVGSGGKLQPLSEEYTFISILAVPRLRVQQCSKLMTVDPELLGKLKYQELN